MASSIDFYAGEDFNIGNLAGSGLGLYGNSFLSSVAVGSYNSRTFITDSTGTSQGPEVDNNMYNGPSGVIVGQTGSGIALTALPNYLATLNIRFTNDTAVKTQNVKLYGYDRINFNNAPSGVNFYAANIIHVPNIQTNIGSGSLTWTLLAGSGSYLTLNSSPGTSGLSPNGPSTTDVRHDHFIALTCTPNTVGSKTFSLGYSLEYL